MFFFIILFLPGGGTPGGLEKLERGLTLTTDDTWRLLSRYREERNMGMVGPQSSQVQFQFSCPLVSYPMIRRTNDPLSNSFHL